MLMNISKVLHCKIKHFKNTEEAMLLNQKIYYLMEVLHRGVQNYFLVNNFLVNNLYVLPTKTSTMFCFMKRSMMDKFDTY